MIIFGSIRTILLLCFVLLCAVAVHSQSESSVEPASSPEITREDDHLPFMRQDRPAEQDAEPSSGMLMVRSLGALLLVVGLIFFGAWGARKLGFVSDRSSSTDTSSLSVVSTVNLGNGRSLSTVNFEGRTLLIGSTANSVTLIVEGGSGANVTTIPRSVAEMLEDESGSFAQEFDSAAARMDEVTAI